MADSSENEDRMLSDDTMLKAVDESLYLLETHLTAWETNVDFRHYHRDREICFHSFSKICGRSMWTISLSLDLKSFNLLSGRCGSTLFLLAHVFGPCS